ncbi:carotenoid biosynthesis protein [Nakamurella leprariae]|uniref:Carotenoid biosynthesis protein n=1 Tax=Nakamurella leprariae TaxID=2803911 RepID=A0A939C0L8_9ACTN|nr:carotenoid biosynthesis protein [Nakamurella leprariae]MBM9468896.1 carotenoid biosynthesis protein [Nakamurella leprariae]
MSHRPRPAGLALAVLTVVVVGLQIAWPLAEGTSNQRLTVLIVVGFAALTVLHVAISRGPARAVLYLLVTAVPGFLVEVLGTHTGIPFGDYTYSDVIGPRLLSVPIVVALAWTMLCWPAACAARALVRSPLGRVLLGAWATTAGDLFLDPQLVSLGAWTWHDPSPHLPGVPTVPLSNYAGWLLVTLVLSALVQLVTGPARAGRPGRLGDGYGVGLYLWSWVAWATALFVFLDQPAAAGWGFLGMGTVAVPLVVVLVRRACAAPTGLLAVAPGRSERRPR